MENYISSDNVFIIVNKTEITENFLNDFNQNLLKGKNIKNDLSGLLTPDNLDKELFYYAFIVPEGVKKLKLCQFKNQAQVGKIFIPSTIENLEFAVYEETNVELPFRNVWVEVSKDNPNYVSENGSVYTKDYSKLIYFYEDENKQYEINDRCCVITSYSLVTIDENFKFPKKLEMIDTKGLIADDISEIKLPEGTKILGENFVSAEEWITVHIPSTVEIIGKNRVRYEISKSNSNFTLVDGNIYSKDMSIFLQGFSAVKLNVKKGCKEVDLSKSEFLEIEIPASVERVYGNHKSNFKFDVAEDNPKFSVHKGSLYSKDFTVLYEYYVPEKNDLIIHPSCKKLQLGALNIDHFEWSKKEPVIKLGNVSIPDCIKDDG